MENYWEIVEHDGTVTRIPPNAVEQVKQRMSNNLVIHTTNRSIPTNQIKQFRKTSELHTDTPLLEAAAQAFNEPLINDTGAVEGRWVKKAVTQQEYAKYYSPTPAYRSLGSENGMIIVAFLLPTHMIDVHKLSYCDDNEVQRLTQFN